MTAKVRVLLTRGVNDRVAEDTKFAQFITESLGRFTRGDWGDVGAEDGKLNDADLATLSNGGWYGRIWASYGADSVVKITRNTAEEDGTQAITVMFPEEY